MKIISSDEIQKGVFIGDFINVLDRAYLMLRNEQAVMPVRTIEDMGEGNPLLFFKPACDNSNHQVVVKLLNQLKENSHKGYPTIQGLVVLFDGVTNEILGVMDARSVTALRTGAASGLATRLLAREDAEVLVVFGAGAQAYTQIKAVMAVRPIRKIIVYDKYRPAIERLFGYFSYLHTIEFVEGRNREQISEADVICTVTGSKSPLFSVCELKEGVHINAIGSFAKDMRELPDDIYDGAYLYVDHKDSCFSESGDIIGPLSSGHINQTNYRGEIVDVIMRKVQGRDSDSRRTVFKSVGIATQDLVAAQYIYEKSVKDQFGTDVAF